MGPPINRATIGFCRKTECWSHVLQIATGPRSGTIIMVIGQAPPPHDPVAGAVHAKNPGTLKRHHPTRAGGFRDRIANIEAIGEYGRLRPARGTSIQILFLNKLWTFPLEFA
jgi:hypothetical protein